MVFYLNRSGFNHEADFVFFRSIFAVNLFSLGVGLFLIMCSRKVHTLISSFLFPIIIYHCRIYQLQSNTSPRKRRKLTPKEDVKGPVKRHLALVKSEFLIEFYQQGSKYCKILVQQGRPKSKWDQTYDQLVMWQLLCGP